jgi:hypothetical protein
MVVTLALPIFDPAKLTENGIVCGIALPDLLVRHIAGPPINSLNHPLNTDLHGSTNADTHHV